jgi:hypothetical protein
MSPSSNSLAAFLLLILASACSSVGPESVGLDSLDATYYLDNREFNTLNLQIATKLPGNLSIWGFTDFHGNQGVGHGFGNLRRSFSEYRLSHGGLGAALGVKGLGMQAEYNLLTPSDQDLGRFGLTYRHDLPLPGTGRTGWLQWRAFPIETDGNGGQASLIYSLPLTESMSIGGFADFNLIEDAPHRWILEPQLNLKVADGFWAVLEYRYNGFEGAGGLDGSGWAAGVKASF